VEITDQFVSYVYRGARAVVWENFKDNPLVDISTEHPTTYYEDMQQPVFCLCPLGWAPWSPRLIEAVIFGCIPVIIGDNIVLPFADAIPWEEIGVFVEKKDVPNLDTILTFISLEVILRKQRLLANPSVGFNSLVVEHKMKKNSRREEELEEDDIIDFIILLNRNRVLLGNKDYSKFKNCITNKSNIIRNFIPKILVFKKRSSLTKSPEQVTTKLPGLLQLSKIFFQHSSVS